MSLLVDYVQPLTNWLQQNPHWSLLITFLISLTESLAIIGSIVPGSLTMTAIGILAGSGIMRVDLTLLAATLGAVAGDSLSYAVGYYYSDRLIDIWPFKKYPKLIQYGKDFFAAHGGKSVLIGRFIGPLRSIIPVIAGILHMKHWQFFIANVLSAIGWSLLYVMPGVIIGAASHELSPESATRLFLLILVLLAGIWMLSMLIKWLFNKLNALFKQHLHSLWLKLKKRPLLSRLSKVITPKNEEDHYTTSLLALTTLLCLFCAIILLGLTEQTQWINNINLPAHLFIQSFHSLVLEDIFIFCTQLTAITTIAPLFIVCCFWFIYNKKPRAIIYLSSLLIISSGCGLILNYFIYNPRPPGLLVLMHGSSFPAINLLVASAFYGFILFYVNNVYTLFSNTLRTVVFTILGLSGLGALYLGDYWLSDVLMAYFSGAVIGLIHCLMYRKSYLSHVKMKHATLMILSLFVTVLLASSLSTYFNYRTISYNHTPYRKEFILSENEWWKQQKPILPIYRLNRIGKRISLLNIQYSGSLDFLEENLALNGWESHTESFFSNLLAKISSQSNDGLTLPLLTQLYENKPPALIMTYTDHDSKLTFELRIWESNYNLSELDRPLWIGSIHPGTPTKNKSAENQTNTDPLVYLLSPKNPFDIRKIMLPDGMIKTTTYTTQPYIVLIKVHEPTKL